MGLQNELARYCMSTFKEIIMNILIWRYESSTSFYILLGRIIFYPTSLNYIDIDESNMMLWRLAVMAKRLIDLIGCLLSSLYRYRLNCKVPLLIESENSEWSGVWNCKVHAGSKFTDHSIKSWLCQYMNYFLLPYHSVWTSKRKTYPIFQGIRASYSKSSLI